MPWRHRSQRPHPAWTSTATRSPTTNSSTVGPTSTIVPMYSWPGVKFLLNGGSPPIMAGGPWLMTSRSVAQMAVASTRTSTSATPGAGTGLLIRLNWPGSPRTHAFIDFIPCSTSQSSIFRAPDGHQGPVPPVLPTVYIIFHSRNERGLPKEALMKLGRLVRLTVAMLALPLLAYAQDATLSGTIKDNTGGVLPGVTVTATNEASGNTFTSVTDERGTYRMPVRAGVYKITAELAGFTTVTRPGIEMLLGRQIALDLNLQVSSLQETVTVTGEAPLLDTSSSTIASNIDPRQM